MLKITAKRISDSDVAELSTEELIQTSFKYISNFNESIVDINTAVTLIKTLRYLNTLDSTDTLQESLGILIEIFIYLLIFY